ncbi:hypothetical protein F2Q68_00025431 [Brassica cretica]|uniref:COX assembly mitochondrial protein n=1 Tax=Brassica cretica TaxID=69181 RepID=A0A8S9I8Z3_BRACR|nr:hypothetical protein F2Q68_00025431 [Brassica cretica]
MHPALTPHRHPMCLEIIEEFQKFYLDHPFGKFFGDCTELKVKLDRCFRRDPLNMSSSGGVGVSDVGISLFWFPRTIPSLDIFPYLKNLNESID